MSYLQAHPEQGQYLWPPGWLVHTQLERRDSRTTPQNCHSSSGFKRKSVWLLPLKEDSRCRRWSRLHIPWGSRVLLMCVCVCRDVCVQLVVCQTGYVFFFFHKKWPVGGKGRKKMKGRETFLSVSHLSCDARWVLFLWLFRKVGRRRGEENKTKTRNRETERTAEASKLFTYLLFYLTPTRPLPRDWFDSVMRSKGKADNVCLQQNKKNVTGSCVTTDAHSLSGRSTTRTAAPRHLY